MLNIPTHSGMFQSHTSNSTVSVAHSVMLIDSRIAQLHDRTVQLNLA